MNEVWDQFIRNEEAFTRLLKLDELLSLNQKVNELIEGRLPRPKEPTPLLTPEAMKMILPLIYEQVRLGHGNDSGLCRARHKPDYAESRIMPSRISVGVLSIFPSTTSNQK